MPGTQGDTLKVVQNLPGVARSSFGSGAAHRLGIGAKGDAGQRRRRRDPDPLPRRRTALDHELRSVRSIDLAPGSYGAEYGRGLGGLVRIDLASLPKEGVHGYVAADVMDASALVSGGGHAAAARRRWRDGYSYLDQSAQARHLRGRRRLRPDPALRRLPGARHARRCGRTRSCRRPSSPLTITSAAPSPRTIPARSAPQNSDLAWKRLILRYTRLLPDGASVVVTPSIGYDTTLDELHFGQTPDQRRPASTWQYALRASYRRKLSLSHDAVVRHRHGGASSTIDRHGSLTLPAREGDITVFGQPPGNAINNDHWTVLTIDTAPYVTAEIAIGRLTVDAGLALRAGAHRGEPGAAAGGRHRAARLRARSTSPTRLRSARLGDSDAAAGDA